MQDERQARDADDPRPLSRLEAEVAGLLPGEPVYGDDSLEPNAEDHRDAERGEPSSGE